MRISINLSDEMLDRVDQEAKRLGTSRGAMLTAWVGEKVASLDMSRQMTEDLQESIQNALGEFFKNEKTIRALASSIPDDPPRKGGRKNAKK